MLTEKELKKAIDSKVYPKVTENMIKKRIVDESYHQIGLTHMLCLIHLDNGYAVSGESACVDERNFDYEIGKTIAYKNAFAKLWPLFGFLLAEELHRHKDKGIHHD